MPRILTSILFLLISNIVFCQKEAAHWVFGGFGGLDFNCSPPQVEVTGFDGLEGGASISSSDGKLLMYTNGDVVWNKDHLIMPNGNGLGGYCSGFGQASASQSSIIIPQPGSNTIYYIFTTDCAEDGFVGGLRYSIVDLALDNGMGDVTTKNQLLIAPAAEKIAACYHENGYDIWLVAHGIKNNIFYTYSITSAGLELTPVQSATGQINNGGRGYLKFSPDGSKLLANVFKDDGGSGLHPELFSFDKSTGKVISEFVMFNTPPMYAASFSPNSKLLYLSCSWICSNPVIEQYNLEAGTPQNIFDSKYVIPGSRLQGACQLGPDGKLYWLTGNTFSVINHPDKIGGECGYTPDYVTLSCSVGSSWGLPNFIESYFQTPITASTQCESAQTNLIENVDFTVNTDCGSKVVECFDASTIKQIDMASPNSLFTWIWDFGDGAIIESHTKSQFHQYANAGVYKIKLTIKQYRCDGYSAEKEIEIKSIDADFNFEPDCNTYRMNFTNTTNANVAGGITWHWDFGDNATTDDQSDDSNAFYDYSSTGPYNVTLTATHACGTSERTKRIRVYEPLDFSLGNDGVICFGIPFRLEINDKPSAQYTWSNGSTTQGIDVIEPGEYSLRVDRDNCFFEDEINFTYAPCNTCPQIPENFSIGRDTTICLGDPLQLLPNIKGSDFLWNDGSSHSSLQIYEPGKYWLSINQGDCTATDTVNIFVRDCDVCEVFIPNVFTPNDDEFNEHFKFSAACDIINLNMEILNKWGKVVYSGSSPYWDGEIKSKEITQGLYYYSIRYSFRGSRQRTITRYAKGWVHILR